MQSCPSCLFHQPLTCSTSSIPGRHVLQRWLDKCLLHWFKSDSVADVACRAWTSVPTRTPTQRICMCSAAVRCTWKSRIICSETKGSRVPASCIILYHLVQCYWGQEPYSKQDTDSSHHFMVDNIVDVREELM